MSTRVISRKQRIGIIGVALAGLMLAEGSFELPEFQAVHEQLGDDVTIVGVANQDLRPASVELADEVGLTSQLGDDPQGETTASECRPC